MTPSEQRYPEGSGSPHPMRVAIVGGGIGGMALALSLHDAGFRDVDVYESASRVKELGVGINVLPHATRELTSSACSTSWTRSGSRPRSRLLLQARPADLGRAARPRRRVPLAAVLHPPRRAARRAPSRRARTARPRARPPRPPSVALRPGADHVWAEFVDRASGAPRSPSRPTCWSAATASTPWCVRPSFRTRARPSGTASRCGGGSPRARRSSPAAR